MYSLIDLGKYRNAVPFGCTSASVQGISHRSVMAMHLMVSDPAFSREEMEILTGAVLVRVWYAPCDLQCRWVSRGISSIKTFAMSLLDLRRCIFV